MHCMDMIGSVEMNFGWGLLIDFKLRKYCTYSVLYLLCSIIPDYDYPECDRYSES